MEVAKARDLGIASAQVAMVLVTPAGCSDASKGCECEAKRSNENPAGQAQGAGASSACSLPDVDGLAAKSPDASVFQLPKGLLHVVQ